MSETVEYKPDDIDRTRADQVVADFAEQLHETITREQITCYGCAQCKACPWAWDLYNTDGDCLALK